MTDDRGGHGEPPHREAPSPQDHGYQEGKRAGAHPFVVVIGVVLGLWLLLWLYVPGSNTHRPMMPPPEEGLAEPAPDDESVMYHVKTAIPELSLVTVVVPRQATDSQVAGLLARFRKARLNKTLPDLLPVASEEHRLSEARIAEIYIFSEPKYATADTVSLLARGAHTPGDLYPRAIPFEVAMEHVRGHYQVDPADPEDPGRASLGFADESGVHSKNYRPLF